MSGFSPEDEAWMRQALDLARRGYGHTSPNPMVGAVLVRNGKVLGEGWHRHAGEPHAEIEAMNHARSKRRRVKGATLYVSLEPCSTQGRTPPCTAALLEAGIEKVIVAAVDPNPHHAGQGLEILRQAGVEVLSGLLQDEAAKLNEPFNHWIVQQTPFVTVKAAMTLDGKIGTIIGESKWITGENARAHAMQLRQASDAVLVGINTVLQDDPSLTVRVSREEKATNEKVEDDSKQEDAAGPRDLRRIILDTHARTPLNAKVVSDRRARLTSIVVGKGAPDQRVAALEKKVNIIRAPLYEGRIDLKWLLRTLGGEGVTQLLVEGGGEVNASFLLQGMAHRIAFYYAPKIVGGFRAPKGVAGTGLNSLDLAVRLEEIEWQTLEPDLLLTAKVLRGAPERRNRPRRRSSRGSRSRSRSAKPPAPAPAPSGGGLS